MHIGPLSDTPNKTARSDPTASITGAHVVHAQLQAEHVGVPVGESGATLVEQDEASAAGEASQKLRKHRFFPNYLDIRNEAERHDEVARILLPST